MSTVDPIVGAGVRFQTRPRDPHAEARLIEAGMHPLLARLHASRGTAAPVAPHASALLAPSGLRGIAAAAARIADAIERGERIEIVADYDCDGATACAVGLLGLRTLGAQVDYLVPNRFKTGYGLTPAIVELAAQRAPNLIVTVDNGIASLEGVERANGLGIDVVVTDHHLPGPALPKAFAIVNPNQPGCTFASKSIAGVGVMFYVVAAVRAALRERGRFDAQTQPRLDDLLDLVALGTVADVVRLDANNRVFVGLGLERIRAGRARPGLLALARVAGRDPRILAASDLGFAIGPRLNAAGRLTDMATGIECLIADDAGRAFELALALDRINAQRRELQDDMIALATAAVEETRADRAQESAIVLRDARFHAGVTGLVASKLKDMHHRPAIVFAPIDDRRLAGSGRSIAGFHLRDAIDLVTKRAPGLVEKFGGHAMAAGLTIDATAFERFADAFRRIAFESLGADPVRRVVLVDGPIEAGYVSASVARMLDAEVWGQGYETPLFIDTWHVVSQRVVKDKHLKAVVERDGRRFDAIAFGRTEALPDRAEFAFRVVANEFNGTTTAQLVIEHAP